MRWRDEQVVQPYAARKAPGARDLQLFLAPLHVDSTTLRVVPVDERVGKRHTECGLGIGGYRHAKQPELQLFLPVPGLEPPGTPPHEWAGSVAAPRIARTAGAFPP